MSDEQPTLFGPLNTPPAPSPPPAPISPSSATLHPTQVSEPLPNPVPRSVSPLAPPTVPGPIQRPYRKVIWPEFLGSISLALGIMGIILSLFTIIPRFLMGSENFMRTWGFGMQMQATVVKHQWFHDLATGLYFLAAIGLGIVGVLLIRRSHAAISWMKWWIPLRIIVAILYAIITIVLNNVNVSSLKASGAIQVQPAQMMTVGTYVTTAMMFLWWISFPALFTYLLIAEKTRSEMSQWTSRATPKKAVPPPSPPTPVQ